MAETEAPDPGLAEERFLRFFREHYPSVRAYVGRRARPELVDDVAAETFLVAWRRLEDVPADARPWLLGVARKVLATQLRTLRRRESLRDRLLIAERPAGEEEEGAATPAAEALARLPEKDREAITLVAWDGLTPKQAAAVLGQSAGAFRVRLHRAKRRMRRELERGATSAAVARMVSVAREAFMTKSKITDEQLFAIVRTADPLPVSGGAAADDGAELLRRLLSTPRRPLVGGPVHGPRSLRLRPRHALLALAVAAAIAVPAVAFADDIGNLVGLSNEGTPVAASTLSKDTSLARAMQEFGFLSTLQLLGTRDGISFYALQKPGGQFCFAVTDASIPTGAQRAASDAGCDGAFPSPEDPVSVSWVGGRFAGFAADGVASVAVVDGSGATLATADVRDNLFVGGSATPTGEITVVSLDANGNVLSTIHSQRVEATGRG